MDFWLKSRYIWTSIWILVEVINASSVPPPNIILVLTDDQDLVLKGMTPMKQTLKLLAENGATFKNAFTTSPMCCPSRASILSGQYAHNHQTINNSASGGCYGSFWRKEIERRTFPVFLKESGYNTFYGGKYMNSYFSMDVPPGYTDFHALLGNSEYYIYKMNENGVKNRYGDREKDYLTDVVRRQFEHFLHQQKPDTPFMAIVAPPASHEPFTPAKRHESNFKKVNALRTPNFNMKTKKSDKHWIVSQMPPSPLPQKLIDHIDFQYRQRWRTLLSVDELIHSMVKILKKMDLYENTFIVFTSDNGYHLGQFTMPADKRQPYETDIRVPFIVTGPGIRTKYEIEHPIALIDLMPTIFDWAGIEKPDYLDGQSFCGLTDTCSNSLDSSEIDTKKTEKHSRKSEKYDRQLLIQYWGEGSIHTYNRACPWQRDDRLNYCSPQADCRCLDSWNNTYACVRHKANHFDKIYCEFDDRKKFIEAYDLHDDHFQMTNTGSHMHFLERSTFRHNLKKLKRCEGKSCQLEDRESYDISLQINNCSII